MKNIKSKNGRKTVILIIFLTAAAVLACLYFLKSLMIEMKYEKLRQSVLVSSAENFRDKLSKVSAAWNGADDVYSAYVYSKIAAEELGRFPMREDMRRAVTLYLSTSAETAKSAIGAQSAPDPDVAAALAAEGGELSAFFRECEISPEGEFISPKSAIPEKTVMQILGADESAARRERRTYYLALSEREKSAASEKKALSALGVKKTGIIKPAYSADNAVYYFRNCYAQTTQNGGKLILFISDREIESERLTEPECLQIAEEYLKKEGFYGYKPDSSAMADGILYADFIKTTRTQKNKIRIGITADSGKVAFFINDNNAF